MEAKDIQQEIFRQVKLRLPAGTALVDAMAELMNISTDSAYRRLRGEKSISLEELQLLCSRYSIAMDALLNAQSGSVVFSGKNLDEHNFNFPDYMDDIIRQLRYFHSFENGKLYYHCKDLPIFHHYFRKELAAFKYYFWMRVLYSEYRSGKVNWMDYPDNLFEKGQEILQLYNSLPSVEIWNYESFSTTLLQIEYFWDTRSFSSSTEVKLLYDQLDELLEVLEEAAEKGRKQPSPETGASGGSFELYHNEMILGHNTIVAQTGNTHMVFLNHSFLNYLGTRDPNFCDYTIANMRNIMRKSTLISAVSERERKVFFHTMHRRIQDKKARL